jgi:hypothetical protein
MPPSGKMPDFDRRPADHLDDLCHIQTGIEIGRVFNREMRHAGIIQRIRLGGNSLNAPEKLSLCIPFGHLSG